MTRRKGKVTHIALDETGVTLKSVRSLTSADAWHFNHSFVGSPKGAESILWTPNDDSFAQCLAVIKR